jgi:hypothetical protein
VFEVERQAPPFYLPTFSPGDFRLLHAKFAFEPVGEDLRLFARRQLADAHGIGDFLAFLALRDLRRIARLLQLAADRAGAALAVERGKLDDELAAAARRAFAGLDLGFLAPLGELLRIDQADR